jgi:ABC-2 type transport system permease protein
MRSWAEERKAGTLEVLLTLPVRTSDLVLGKFAAGMLLVVLALLCTVPLPLAVASLGELDWGPVVGGYFAAFMLASAYMAIGLCVSSRTDNQVVALMLTLVLGGLLWLVGTRDFVSLFDGGTAEILRALGTGSRFESVERGVLDLRDIVYYASLTVFFLALNGVFLASERLDPGSARGRSRSTALAVASLLVALNAIAANVWLTPIHRARVDLTENRDYTISPVTKRLVASLDEPLRIRGFFSESTHPLLAPLVPQIRDLLAEYEIYGDGNVKVEIADPNQDEALESEINEQYAVRSVPFGVTDRHSQSVVNAYFHIVLAYGDAFEVLDFSDLVEVRSEAMGVTVKLKNFEYDLTRGIKKVTQEFQTVESLLARVPEGSKVTLYRTANVPEEYAATGEAMKKVAEEYAAAGAGRLTFAEVDPSSDTQLQTELYEKYGVQPLAADLFATQRFYLHLVVQVGDQVERILPRGDMAEADVRKALDAAVRRGTPGQLRKVLLVTENPPQEEQNPNLPPQMQPPQRQPDYTGLEQYLSENYTVERTELREGEVPDDVDVLIVGKPGPLDPRQQYALDQYLMRGGTIVALAGRYHIEPSRQGLSAVQEPAPLFDLLQTWGVSVRDALVMGDDVAAFPLPVQRRLPGGAMLQKIELMPYPFFPDLRGESLNDDVPALAGVPSLTMPWSSPLTVAEPLEGREVTWLLRSSPLATVKTGGQIDPDSVTAAGPAWTPGPETGAPQLGTVVTGKFPSAFAERPNPNDAGATGPDTSGRTLTKSIADGRLVVLGSSELASDLLITLANQTQAEEHAGNLQLLFNTVDWATEDTDLLQIRTAGPFARTLRPLDEAEQTRIELMTWLAVLVPVLVIVAVPRIRRRNVRPLPLAPAETT